MKQLIILILVFLFFDVVQLKLTNEVQPFKTNLKQKWGYTEVYPDVYLFWWFYMQNPSTKPLLIWLGFYSNAEANFNQYGPISSDSQWRNNSLIYDYNILFIDSMAGAGFSYVKEKKLFTRSTHETAYDLFSCIKLFFIKFPNFKTSPVYIVADSFFGKIAPELARLWHVIGSRENLPSNLKGLIIGDDPYLSLQAELWQNYEIIKNNRITENQKIDIMVNEIERLKKKELWLNASEKIDSLFNDYSSLTLYKPKSLINSTIAFVNQVLTTTNNKELNKLMNNQVKEALKLQSSWKISQSAELINNVATQSLNPTFKMMYKHLLKTTELKLVFLNTPMDLKIHTKFTTLEWINYLDCEDKNIWSIQNKIPFTFNNKIEGYIKNYKNLYQYSLIRNSNADFDTNADFLRTVFVEVME